MKRLFNGLVDFLMPFLAIAFYLGIVLLVALIGAIIIGLISGKEPAVFRLPLW